MPPAATYKAPDKPGVYNVMVEVKWGEEIMRKTVSIKVSRPANGTTRPSADQRARRPAGYSCARHPAARYHCARRHSIPTTSAAAATALPVSVPTVLATTAPAASDISPLQDIFAQGLDGEDWSWSDAPGSLTTQFVEDKDCYRSGRYGLRLVYSFTDNGNGGWGVHWANTSTKHFTATQFTAFTFAVRGTAPNGFQIGLKDTTGFEVKLEANGFVGTSASEWKTVTIPLNRFAHQGKQVKIASVENINFGFHKGHGSGNICIDEIAFQ